MHVNSQLNFYLYTSMHLRIEYCRSEYHIKAVSDEVIDTVYQFLVIEPLLMKIRLDGRDDLKRVF